MNLVVGHIGFLCGTICILLSEAVDESLSMVGKHGSPPRFTESVQTEFHVVIGTKQFRLICPVETDDDELVMVQWKKDDETIGLESNARFKFNKLNRELKIRNLKVEDSGVYQCQAINGFGHRELEFTLHVFDPEVERTRPDLEDIISLSKNPSAPRWVNETAHRESLTTPIQLFVGDELHLKCPAIGNPLPRITWLFNGKPLLRDETIYSRLSSSLFLRSIQKSDSGRYMCKLENVHGTIEGSFEVFVDEFFTKSSPSMSGSEYSNEEWMDNDSVTGDSNIDRRVVGDISDRFSAAEHASVPVINEPLNSTIHVGHTAQFQCKVRSDHPPIIKWLKRVSNPSEVHKKDANATIINANNMHLLVLDHPQIDSEYNGGVYINRLVIPNAGLQHAGTYICVVTSVDGIILYKAAYLNILPRYQSLLSLSTVFVYVGVPVLLLVLGFTVYAVYFLCTEQNRKPIDCVGLTTPSANTVKPVSSVRIPSDGSGEIGGQNRSQDAPGSTFGTSGNGLRPPPPSMPPPRTPFSTLESLHKQRFTTNTSHHPMSAGDGYTLQSPDRRYFHYIGEDDHLKRYAKSRNYPVLVHRTFVDDTTNGFCEGSSQRSEWCCDMSAPLQAKRGGGICETVDERDEDCLSPSYSKQIYPECNNKVEQQLPFILKSTEERCDSIQCSLRMQ